MCPSGRCSRTLRRQSSSIKARVFKRVYEDEFGIAGGHPYGLLIGDYDFTNHPDDVDLLAKLSGVAAAAFAPVVTSAAPELLGLDDMASLEQPVNLASTFEQVEYVKWRALRERNDSKFLGLTAPKILMRQPYVDDGSHQVGFRFREQVEGADRSRYLWGSAAWAFASIVIRAYADCGWFADIRGAQRGVESGGLVTNLETHAFATDPFGVALKSSTEVAINESQEKHLSELGFIPLCDSKDTEYSVFYANQSVHKPKTYDDPVASMNARVSAMLQYVLCASRFAHYLKILARRKVGSMQEAARIQQWLNEWLTTYVTPDEKAPPEQKARFPLRAGETEVSEIPGQPGKYSIKMHLLPHYQLDELTATVRLVARVSAQRSE